MLNSPYTSSALTASSLPTLLTTVSSTAYSSQQTFATNPQFGIQAQQPGASAGLPYGGYGPQTMMFPQASPYGGGVPFAAGGYPAVTGGQPVPGQLYYQPGRIITGYTQAMYRAYIPPSISVVPAYPTPMAPQAGPMPMGYGPRWI
jgi:hypothetical protein